MSELGAAFLIWNESPGAIVVAASVATIAVPVDVMVSSAGMVSAPQKMIVDDTALLVRLQRAERDGDRVGALHIGRAAAGAFRREVQRLQGVQGGLHTARPRFGRVLDAGGIALRAEVDGVRLIFTA